MDSLVEKYKTELKELNKFYLTERLSTREKNLVLQQIRLVEGFISDLEAHGNCKLYRIKRELITDFLKTSMPITVSAKKPLSWWLDNKFAKEDDLELVK